MKKVAFHPLSACVVVNIILALVVIGSFSGSWMISSIVASSRGPLIEDRALVPSIALKTINGGGDNDLACARHWQLDYARFHATAIESQPTSNLLIYRPVMGWGNQVWHLAQLLSFAVLTRRVLLIDMGHHSGSMDRIPSPLLPNKINWTIGWPIPDLKEENYNNYSLSELQKKPVLLPDDGSLPSIKDLGLFPNEDLASILLGESKGMESLLLPPECVCRFLFKRSEELESLLLRTLHELRGAGGQPYIAMHIRMGKGEGEHSHFVSNASYTLAAYFNSAFQMEEEHRLGPGTKWLVATDDLETGLQARGLLPGKVVLTNTNLTIGTGLHPRRYKGADKNLDVERMREGLLLGFLDWFLLAESDHLICADSSFCDTAARFGRKHCKDLEVAVPSALGSLIPLRVCTRLEKEGKEAHRAL